MRRLWKRRKLIAIGMLLIGGGIGAGLVSEYQRNQHYRVADAVTLSQNLLQLYVLGQEEGKTYPEIRHFFQRHPNVNMAGIAVINERGQVRNEYPPEFTRTSYSTARPIRGEDGVVRDHVTLYYHAMFKPHWPTVAGWGAGGLLLFLAVLLYDSRQRIKQMQQAAELQQLQADKLRQEAQIETMSAFWEGYRELLDEESGRLANRLQEMGNIVAHLNTNLADVVHDLKKSPIGSGDLYRVDALLAKLRDERRELPREDLITFVTRIQETMTTIKWVIDELPELASLEEEDVDIREELETLRRNPPPALRKSWLKLKVSVDDEVQFIRFQRAHFRSVIKNALYNACRELEMASVDDEDLVPTIEITASRREGLVGVTVADNGPGLSPVALERLYRGIVHEGDSTRGKGSVIVQAYLALHRGKAEVENRPEGGAACTFWFREATPSMAGAESAASLV